MNVMIAVTNMTAANGGVTTHIIDLCKELVRRNNKAVLVFDDTNCDYTDSIKALEKLDGFKCYMVNMSNIQSNPKQLFFCFKSICKIVKQEKIDIIHTHSQSLCVVSAMIKLRTGTPYIWTNHIDAIANPKVFSKILRILHFPIISVSTDLKAMLIKDYCVKEARISVVNNGIDIEKFPPMSDKERIDLRKKYECDDKYVIGLLARISVSKGHMYLLKAVKQLQDNEKIKDIKVLIAGKVHSTDKGYFAEIMKYAKTHNIDVNFLGFQNPRDIFGLCDISVLPSIFEGFGLTVLESLSMNCPVIRSNTPGWMDTKEISLIFKKTDVNGLSEQLLYAYNNRNEMKAMGETGRSCVMEKFTIKEQVDNTLKVYEKYIK